uniref:hypothetical protein n=1 Tax=Kitasatospora fiedleri TaxID=2991545 RepID=UPI00249B0823|nr:hypothetical protein [Kitasatospora fiedleri]
MAPPLREFIEASPRWLTVFHLHSHAPGLNSQEGIWTLVKRGMGNLAAADPSQITWAVKHRLKQIQHHPDLVGDCLVGTGLIMNG